MTNKVVLFSGGRTSGYMLRRLIDQCGLEAFKAQFVVCFANTGREMPETLDFVHRVEVEWGVPIVWVEYFRVPAATIKPGIYPTPRRNANLARSAARGEFVHWFRKVDYVSASRNGEPFEMLLDWMGPLPNVVSRACSMQLKIRTVMRYLFAQGWSTYEPYIGIRKDEEIRKVSILAHCDSYEKPQFPLVEWRATEAHVLNFWEFHPFDLELKSYQGNCDLCFLKQKGKLIQLIRNDPDVANWWILQEKKKSANVSGRGAQFNRHYSYQEVVDLAKTDAVVPWKGQPEISCSCAERGFEPDEEERAEEMV